MTIERSIANKLRENRISSLNETSFDIDGKHYTSAFGKYSCDGQEITRDEYFKAKSTVENGGSSEEYSGERYSKWDAKDADLSSYASLAGSSVKKGKQGPYYYAGEDHQKFNQSVLSIVHDFSEGYPDMKQSALSSSQTVYYDEATGNAIIVKHTGSKPWCQVKKLTDEDRAKIVKSTPSKSGPTKKAKDISLSDYTSDPETTVTTSGNKTIVELSDGDMKNTSLIKALKKSGYKQYSDFRFIKSDSDPT